MIMKTGLFFLGVCLLLAGCANTSTNPYAKYYQDQNWGFRPADPSRIHPKLITAEDAAAYAAQMRDTQGYWILGYSAFEATHGSPVPSQFAIGQAQFVGADIVICSRHSAGPAQECEAIFLRKKPTAEN